MAAEQAHEPDGPAGRMPCWFSGPQHLERWRATHAPVSACRLPAALDAPWRSGVDSPHEEAPDLRRHIRTWGVLRSRVLTMVECPRRGLPAWSVSTCPLRSDGC